MMQVLRLAAAGMLAAALGCAPIRHAADASPEDVFPIGVSQIDITPDEPIRLAGYGSRTAPSEGIGQRLWAKAIAFGNDQRPAVLITADLVGVPRDVTEDVARRLQKRGLERAQLAVAVTHTHTGPSLTGVLPYIFGTPIAAEQEAVIARYSRQLADKLEQAAIAALADRRPSRVAWAVGRVAFAANRRVLKDGKWTAFGIAPAGPVDHELPLLAVRGADGSLRAVLVSYACHATTLEAKHNAVHGDWPGAAQALIQQRHAGAVAMVAIGAGADANPNPRGGGLQDVDRHAEEVAEEVDRLLATPLRPVTESPVGRFRYVDLSFSRIPERGELAELARKTDTNGYYARSLLERLDRGERIPRTVAYPVQTWTYGDALAMVFLGGEVVADYGLRLKRELDSTRLWVNAYANDVAFYVASKRMIPEGGYEVDRSMVYYGQPGPLADSTEDLIVRTVRELLPAGFRQRAGR
jgi:neutral ceramidase